MNVKLYLSTELQTENRHLMNDAANFLLTPVRYFASGKTYQIVNGGACEIPHITHDSWLKTALMVAAFIPGLILGAFARWFSTVHEEVREGFSLVKRASSEPPKTPGVSSSPSNGAPDSTTKTLSRSPGQEHLNGEHDQDRSRIHRRTASGGELSPSATEDDEPPAGPQRFTTTSTGLATSTSHTGNRFAVLGEVGEDGRRLPRSPSQESFSSVDDDQHLSDVDNDAASTSSEEAVPSFNYSDPAQLRKDIGTLLDFFSAASTIGQTKAPTWLEAQFQKLKCNPFLQCSNLNSEQSHLIKVVGKPRYDRLEKSYHEACVRMNTLKLDDWLTKVSVGE